jgi:putative ABC transport system substrate-binding protein
MSYNPDPYEVFRRSAWYIDRILRGANPADLPVEQPTKLRLVINLKTAKELRLAIPTNVLLRADHPAPRVRDAAAAGGSGDRIMRRS